MRAQRTGVPVKTGGLVGSVGRGTSTMFGRCCCGCAAHQRPEEVGFVMACRLGVRVFAFQESFACSSFVRHIVYYLDV